MRQYLHVIPYGEFVQEPQVRFAKRSLPCYPTVWTACTS